MVRKGSRVRVRQRASQTALRRGSLVLGVDQVTTSLMDRGSPVQASVATSSGERGFAARAAVVLDAIIRHGGPAGYSVGTVRPVGCPCRGQRSCATRSPRDELPKVALQARHAIAGSPLEQLRRTNGAAPPDRTRPDRLQPSVVGRRAARSFIRAVVIGETTLTRKSGRACGRVRASRERIVPLGPRERASGHRAGALRPCRRPRIPAVGLAGARDREKVVAVGLKAAPRAAWALLAGACRRCLRGHVVSRIVPSALPVATVRPSGLTDADSAASAWPASTGPTGGHVFVDHIRAQPW